MFKRYWLYHTVWLNILLLGLMGVPPYTFAQDETFSYNNFSLALPKGWVKQDISERSEKELIGSLKSQEIPGTSISIFCYKGEGYNYSSVRIAGLKTIASGFPKGQERLKKETKVKIDGGLSAIVELWRGAVDASGTTAFLQVPMGIIKTKSGWILMLGFTPDSTGAQLEEAFLQMIQSAKYESASQGVVGFANLSFQLPDR